MSRYVYHRPHKCAVCNYQYADKHHLHPQAMGGKGGKTIWLCPNHHRYVHMIYELVDELWGVPVSLTERKLFDDGAFTAQWFDYFYEEYSKFRMRYLHAVLKELILTMRAGNLVCHPPSRPKLVDSHYVRPGAEMPGPFDGEWWLLSPDRLRINLIVDGAGLSNGVIPTRVMVWGQSHKLFAFDPERDIYASFEARLTNKGRTCSLDQLIEQLEQFDAQNSERLKQISEQLKQFQAGEVS